MKVAERSPSKKKLTQLKLKSLKETLRFRNTSPSQDKSNRSSAQRISLFKYKNVQVMNCFMPVQINDEIDLLRMKPTGLLARGPLELYEIRTISSSSFYLTVGRHGELVHPLLPKLRVTRLEPNGRKFLIAFANPDRFWEVEFLSHSNTPSDTLDISVTKFGLVLSNICQYSCLTSHLNSPEYEKGHEIQGILSIPEQQESENDETDVLNYLLEEETDVEEDSDTNSRVGDKLGDLYISKRNSNHSVNEAFRAALNNVVSPWYAVSNTPQIESIASHNKMNFRRTSLYIPTTTTVKPMSFNRRSISMFSEYDTLVSLESFKL